MYFLCGQPGGRRRFPGVPGAQGKAGVWALGRDPWAAHPATGRGDAP